MEKIHQSFKCCKWV